MPAKPLHERISWVTGASRGIGRAIAIALARAGSTAILAARSVEDCRQTAEILRAEGLSAHAEHLDVTNKESIAAFVEKAVKVAGPPSILVNNAGGGLFKDMTEMPIEEFDRQIDVNLKAPWYMARAAAPHMKRFGQGHIINISSIAGEHSFKRGTAYCATKAGLNAMSEAMMLELREFNIRVTVIAPGSVQTGFHAEALPAANLKDQSWMIDPETIGAACLHVLTLPENATVSHYEIRPTQPVK